MSKTICPGRRKKSGGSAIVEFALMVPWILFLFVGILDFGFYSYAAICTQNAARAAAVAAATGNGSVSPCQAAIGELNGLPNMIGVVTCGVYPASANASQPSVCTATLGNNTNSDSSCSSATTCADCPLDNAATSIQATVTYQSLPMVPIPGLLMGTLKLTRTTEIRVVN